MFGCVVWYSQMLLHQCLRTNRVTRTGIALLLVLVMLVVRVFAQFLLLLLVWSLLHLVLLFTFDAHVVALVACALFVGLLGCLTSRLCCHVLPYCCFVVLLFCCFVVLLLREGLTVDLSLLLLHMVACRLLL